MVTFDVPSLHHNDLSLKICCHNSGSFSSGSCVPRRKRSYFSIFSVSRQILSKSSGTPRSSSLFRSRCWHFCQNDGFLLLLDVLVISLSNEFWVIHYMVNQRRLMGIYLLFIEQFPTPNRKFAKWNGLSAAGFPKQWVSKTDIQRPIQRRLNHHTSSNNFLCYVSHFDESSLIFSAVPKMDYICCHQKVFLLCSMVLWYGLH